LAETRAGATIAAIGSTLLRSPGISRDSRRGQGRPRAAEPLMTAMGRKFDQPASPTTLCLPSVGLRYQSHLKCLAIRGVTAGLAQT
jgi:hypothetical protein